MFINLRPLIYLNLINGWRILLHQTAVIGLYRDVWIAAIASSTTSLATRTAAICVRFQGRRVRRVYVTMQIMFLTRKSALIYRRGLRQRVASLTLDCNGDFAIRAYGTFAKVWKNKIFFGEVTLVLQPSCTVEYSFTARE